METLASSSSSKQLFVKKYKNNGGFSSPHLRTLFTRPKLGFLQFQNVDFSHSISLQMIKAIEPGDSWAIPFPSSEVAEEGDMTAEAPTQEPYTGKTAHVRFVLQKECVFGERFLLVGDDPIFGQWNPSDAIPLEWSEGHFWSVELDIPVGKVIRFKFVLEGTMEEELVWQPDPDRTLQVWETKNTIVVSVDWENAEAQKITEEEPGAKEELTADSKSEDTSNIMEVLLVAENMSCLIEELPVADNISNPQEEKTAAENKSISVDDENDLVDYEGEPVLAPGLAPLPSTVSKDTLPAVRDTISNKDASVELNGHAVQVEDGNMPEKYKKKEQDDGADKEQEIADFLEQANRTLFQLLKEYFGF